MRRSNYTLALYLALVFLSGLIVGAYGYRFISVNPERTSANQRPNPEEWRKQYVKEMQTRLHLTPEQLQKLSVVMDETRSRVHEERSKHDQSMKKIRDESTDKVRAFLNPNQLPEYEKLRAEREQRAKAVAANR